MLTYTRVVWLGGWCDDVQAKGYYEQMVLAAREGAGGGSEVAEGHACKLVEVHAALAALRDDQKTGEEGSRNG